MSDLLHIVPIGHTAVLVWDQHTTLALNLITKACNHHDKRQLALEEPHLDLHGGWSEGCQLFGRALTNASQHGVASREHDVVVQVLTNVHMMDWKVVLWGKEARQLWAVEAWLPTDVSIWKLEASSRCRSPKQWSTSLALEGGVVDAFVFLTMAGNARQNNRRASNWDDDSIYEFMKTETQRSQEHYFRHSTLLTICLKPAVMHSACKPIGKRYETRHAWRHTKTT